MDTVIGTLLTICGICVVLFLLVSKHKNSAWNDYIQALEELKRDPNNPALREIALSMGRQAAQVFATYGDRSIDEMTIKNDIDARVAGASFVTSSMTVTPFMPTTQSSAERLRDLNELYAAKLISEDEFFQKREHILREL
jgi:hypothetical protein